MTNHSAAPLLPEQLRLISANLSALGARRLTMLALTAALTLGALATLGWWASRPATITLYSGLQRDDVNRIGPALSQAGIAYDVSADGETVLVEPSNAGRARMILAEQGLPRSTGSGYELFETMGSLGLTSFMQQVTRVRALEGEISRSIRLVDGVRAARVHIVLPDRASFATRDRKASASVLLQTDARMDAGRADAIRHLVAAAVPGLDNEGVTILGASGRLLASGADPTSGSLTGKFAMQRMVEAQLTANAVRVLEPWLGAENFRVSVQADLDTDESRTEETIFDPDSRVERSVQVVKTEESNSERAAASETSVGQDIPEEENTGTSDGTASRQASERREETTNYEINSKRVATVRAGYAVTGLSASIVINRERLATLGVEPLTDEALLAHLADARRSVLAAIGYDEARGDVVNVEALAFADTTIASAAATPLTQQLAMQAGGVVRALAMVAAVALVLLLGWRPAVRMVLASGTPALTADPAAPALGTAQSVPALSAQTQTGDSLTPMGAADLPNADRSVQERLRALADKDEERAAEVLRSWLSTNGPALGARSEARIS